MTFEDIPAWWIDTMKLTDEQLEKLREQYEREQIESAQGEADFAAIQQEYRK